MFALLILLGVASTTGFSFGSRTVGVNVHGDVTALKMVNVLRSLNHYRNAKPPIRRTVLTRRLKIL